MRTTQELLDHGRIHTTTIDAQALNPTGLSMCSPAVSVKKGQRVIERILCSISPSPCQSAHS